MGNGDGDAGAAVDGEGVRGRLSAMAATHDEHREFWSSHAVRTLHWFTHDGDWLTHDGDNERLTGWSSDAMPVVRHASEHWQPWNELVDNSCAPFVRWFSGGLLNAAFNEIDRHVLCGHGNATAFVSDPTDGRLCLRNLLIESVLAAMVLTKLCTRSSSRVALYLPNGFDAVSWASASKRIGCPHVAISGGTASRAVAERLDDTGAAVLVTGASLLPAGVTGLSGRFGVGDLVSCVSGDGAEIARGLIAYDSAEVEVIMGHGTGRIPSLLGYSNGRFIDWSISSQKLRMLFKPGQNHSRILNMTFSSDKIVDAIIGKAAFFAPEQVIVPESLFPPLINNFSILESLSL